MDEKDLERNRPAEDGLKNDPDIRDRSGIQPGTDTISKSKSDPSNQQLTETARDDFRTKDQKDEKADPRYDEIDKE